LSCGATGDEEYEQILTGGGRQADIYRRLRALADAADAVPAVLEYDPIAFGGIGL
jgi:hypothetical protein